MLDHALGRPDARYRKYQIFAVVLAWAAYLWRGNRHGPKFLRPLSKFLGKRLTVWHVVVITGLHYYVLRNLSTVVGLQYPEPLANMYSKEYFIATWVTTALDAGFWTAMNFRPKWLRDISSVAFSLYYLVAADQADEMVRRVRGSLTKEHLRVSWNKPNTPYLAFANRMLRPRHLAMKYRPRRFVIDRPKGSAYKESINAWLYFDGPTSQLKHHDKVILDIPGGGFVAMDPRCHDDKLMAWAVKTGFPIVALDYRKAPEYPYPYALNECFDAYYQIMASRGQIIGLTGASVPKVIISGDSAGGNLAAGLMMMILDQSPHSSYIPGDSRLRMRLPIPTACILIYPALDVNITSWMNDEQIALMHQRKRRHINQGVIDSKRSQYFSLTNTPYASEDEDDEDEGVVTMKSRHRRSKQSPVYQTAPVSPTAERLTAATSSLNFSNPQAAPSNQAIKTRLYMRSMIAYFNDRILSPEMLRGMIMMYVGEHNRPDFETDYLLSPILAPENLLAQFPKCYMLTGERDPLIDDTVLFAARIRQAKLQLFRERQELGLIPESVDFNDEDYVETYLVPRVSHGFLQFAGIYRRGWDYIEQCSRWMKEAFAAADDGDALTPGSAITPLAEGGEKFESDYFTRSRDRLRKREKQARASNNASGTMPTISTSPTSRRNGALPGGASNKANGAADGNVSGNTSDAEDRPLEMSALRMTPMPGSAASTTNAKNRTARERRGSGSGSSGRGIIRKPAVFSGRKSPVLLRHNRSLQRLASTEDLMDRRMTELAEGLKGHESAS